MNVLSLFDGMSCGRITLSELGIPVEKYYASEVDKFAIKATMQNFPDTIQLGDVRELEVSRLDKIDLIIGGSPCTNLSMIIYTPNIADITIPNKYIKKNIRSIDDKAHTLLATSHKGAMANGMMLVDNGNFRIRRLTPTECARLQTVPEWYIWDGISDTQRYKMLGNGWNIETIKHIFKYLEKQ